MTLRPRTSKIPRTLGTRRSWVGGFSSSLHPAPRSLLPAPRSLLPAPRSGYTLVELLVATVLTLMLMTAVVQVFSRVGSGISNARNALEQFSRLRDAESQLRMDLAGATALALPPQRLEAAPGYLEIIAGSWNDPLAVDANGTADSTVGRRGDILILTTRSTTQPFIGRYGVDINGNVNGNPGTIQSYVAEVAWFVRGRTLHRRVLLVAPTPTVQQQIARIPIASIGYFFAYNDISVRLQNGMLVANTLADLTKRENRFAHPTDAFPFDASRWGQLGLPTLRECSSPTWMRNWVAGTTPTTMPPLSNVMSSTPPRTPSPFAPCASADIWGENKSNDVAQALPEAYFAADGTRMADDVVLNNVIGFQVSVWDNQLQQFVELGYQGSSTADFSSTHPPVQPPAPGLWPNYYFAEPTYDTWSQSYENEGVYHFNPSNGNFVLDQAGGNSTNGFDDDGNGIVDDAGERITSPPYLAPLRGIQVKIRCFEPDSRQVREVTVEPDFLPK